MCKQPLQGGVHEERFVGALGAQGIVVHIPQLSRQRLEEAVDACPGPAQQREQSDLPATDAQAMLALKKFLRAVPGLSRKL